MATMGTVPNPLRSIKGTIIAGLGCAAVGGLAAAWLGASVLHRDATAAGTALRDCALAIEASHAAQADFAELRRRIQGIGARGTFPDLDASARADALAAATGREIDEAASALTGRSGPTTAARARTAFAVWLALAAPGHGRSAWRDDAGRGDSVAAAIEATTIAAHEDAGRIDVAIDEKAVGDARTGGAIIAAMLSALAGMAAFVGWRLLRPIRRASDVVRRMAAGDMGAPIAIEGTDEIAVLLRDIATIRDSVGKGIERMREEARAVRSRLENAVEGCRDGIILIDRKGRFEVVNTEATRMFAWLHEKMAPGLPARRLMQAIEPREDIVEAAMARIAEGGSIDDSATYEMRAPDGAWLRLSRNATEDGGIIVVAADVTDIKAQEMALGATNESLEATLENMSQGICMYGADRRLRVHNRRFIELFGLPAARISNGMPLAAVVSLIAAVDGRLCADERLATFEDRIAAGCTCVDFLELADSRTVAAAFRPLGAGGWVITYEDVTDQITSQARIQYLARNDPLTGLPNRREYEDHVNAALKGAKRGRHFALLMLDLDNFKKVNDTLGHPAGDALLREAAARIRSCLREGDMVARLGGDEFAIVQNGVGQARDPEALAQRIIDAIGRPFDVAGASFEIGISLGIALSRQDGESFEALMKNADVALYRAKAEGRNRWRFFKIAMDEALQRRRLLERDLREAVLTGALDVHYQPLFDIAAGRIGGVEALVRWFHPVRGMVSPADFIPLAEEVGLIGRIGEIVLAKACRAAAAWPEPIKVAVNVSPRQFAMGGLAEGVAKTLAASGLAPERLEIEITESVLIDDDQRVLVVLERLREMGCSISLDDFGTGYSSLSYLQKFAFDKVKIDQSFTRNIGLKEDSRKLVKCVLGMCQTLGIRTTAEGVETQEQFDFLADNACGQIQGWLISKAVPADAIPDLLTRWNRNAEGMKLAS